MQAGRSRRWRLVSSKILQSFRSHEWAGQFGSIASLHIVTHSGAILNLAQCKRGSKRRMSELGPSASLAPLYRHFRSTHESEHSDDRGSLRAWANERHRELSYLKAKIEFSRRNAVRLELAYYFHSMSNYATTDRTLLAIQSVAILGLGDPCASMGASLRRWALSARTTGGGKRISDSSGKFCPSAR